MVEPVCIRVYLNEETLRYLGHASKALTRPVAGLCEAAIEEAALDYAKSAGLLAPITALKDKSDV